MAVSYEILAGSPKFNFQREGSTGSMEVLIAWGDINALAAEMFPPPFFVNGFLFFPPRGTMPGYSWLKAESMTVEPFPADLPGGGAADSHAKCNLTFKADPREEDEDGETLLTHTYDVGGEFLTLPQSGMRWEGGDPIKQEDITAGKIVPQVEHQMTWEQVPFVPIAAIRANIGTVNGGPFFGASSESLLFVGAQITRTVTTDGQQPYKVDYRFSERVLQHGSYRVGWNHFFNPDNGQWRRIVSVGTGAYVYRYGNFGALFS